MFLALICFQVYVYSMHASAYVCTDFFVRTLCNDVDINKISITLGCVDAANSLNPKRDVD